jgi:hypothetical protein
MNRFFVILFFVVTFLFSCNKSDQNNTAQRPFPQEISYKSGYILPDVMSRDDLNKKVQDYYFAWKTKYIKQCADGTYYVDFSDENPDVSTVSEAIGYGMVITAYMAGADPKAKEIFDGLYRFYIRHPSNICSSFMAWRQGKDCRNTGFDSATDGDEDAAFALLLADKQWGSNGDINYKQAALKIINALKICVFHSQGFPLLGDWAKGDSTEPVYLDATRSSDWMLDHYLAFYNATGDEFWLDAIDKIISLVDSIQINYSSNTGLIPDFIIHTSTSPQPAYPNFLESQYDGDLYYNACRTPWRLTTGQLFLDDDRLVLQIQKINNWIIAKTGNNAQNIMAGYKLDGTPIANYQDICFTGGFAVAAMISKNQTWLNSCFNALIQPSINDNTYFGNTLRMLYLLVLSGNYWLP